MTDQVLDAAPASQEPAQADTSFTPNTPASPESESKPTENAQVETKEPTKSTPKSAIQEASQKQTEDTQKYWGDDWKQKMAGEDEKLLKNLEKYKTPADFAKAHLELQKKFSETRPAPQLPKEATPEQIKEYREKLGIPDSPDKYDIKLDNVVIGDHDKPVVDAWLQKAHAANMTPAQVNQVLQSYFEVQNEIQTDLNQKAEAHNEQFKAQLQKEWGVNPEANLNKVATYLQKELGQEAFARLTQAQLPDGTFLINDSKLVNHFLASAKSMNTNTITPSTSDTTSVLARKAELDKIAKDDSRLWFNSPELRKEAAELDAILKSKKG